MTTQINFKLHGSSKSQFEQTCYRRDVEMARCLRALTLAFTQDRIPQHIVNQALALESEEYPETRGRKPSPTSRRNLNSAKKQRKKAA